MICKLKKTNIKRIFSSVVVSGLVFIGGFSVQASAQENGQAQQQNEWSATVKPVDFLNIRTNARSNAAVVGKINTGDKVQVKDEYINGWYLIKTVDGVGGWVNGKFLNVTGGNTTIKNEKIKKVLDIAYKQLGKPYRWGATGPSCFDCSGLTSYAYKQGANVALPRVSREQANVGKKVSKADLQPGDLMFFGSGGSICHVGMYVGGNKFIHSPQTGDVVKVVNVNSGSYGSRFITAVRVIQ